MNHKAFTRTELLVVVAVIVLGFMMLASSYTRAKERAQRIRCTSHLKQLGLSYKTWALDRTNRFPQELSSELHQSESPNLQVLIDVYRSMSNELSTPVVLTCPADKERQKAWNWQDLGLTNLSYFVGLSATESNPRLWLAGDRNLSNSTGLLHGRVAITTNDPPGWTEKIHRLNGNILLSDGSVQQISTARLRSSVETNWLAIP